MWNALTEAGGAVVGDEVKIHAEVQLVKQSQIITTSTNNGRCWM